MELVSPLGAAVSKPGINIHSRVTSRGPEESGSAAGPQEPRGARRGHRTGASLTPATQPGHRGLLLLSLGCEQSQTSARLSSSARIEERQKVDGNSQVWELVLVGLFGFLSIQCGTLIHPKPKLIVVADNPNRQHGEL